MPRAAVVSCTHGAGPLPILNHPSQVDIIQSFKTKAPQILRLGTPDAPRAILVVTAHWEADVPTISGAARHPLMYDYFGFPPEAYEITYDAPGSPDIAKEVYDVLQKAGLSPKIDYERGWDHGVFVPMSVINPAANIPIIQMSVLSAQHEADSTEKLLKMGAALSAIRDANVAIVGSGVSTFHNLRLIRVPERLKGREALVEEWSRKLSEVVMKDKAEERQKELRKWREFPGADICHPYAGAEHLFPLFVCAGAAGDSSAKTWVDNMMGADLVSYYWD